LNKKICGIYVIVNCNNKGKRYIGKSVNIVGRWKNHKREMDKGISYCTYLQNAWNKWKSDSFVFYVLEECPEEELDNREDYYIKFFDTRNPEKGYNLCAGGGGITNPSPETRARLSKVHKGKPKSEEFKKKVSLGKTGKKRPARSIEERKTSSIVRQGKSKGLINGVKTSKYVGVYLEKKVKKNPWIVEITKDGKKIHIGSYDTELKAGYAYNLSSLRYFGENALLNKLNDEEMESLKDFVVDFEKIESGNRWSSRYYGVSRKKLDGKYKAFIYDKNGKQIYLGTYIFEAEAALVVNQALLEFYGYKAQSKLNIIPQSEIDLLWSDCTDPTNELP
jgi:group I intron endonuclease